MQENIDYSSPDDGLGDKLRNAFIKVQNNFTQLFNGKVDKITGKGLSENDFTDADKAKLTGIEAGAQVNVNADFGENDPDAPGYILNRLPSMYASVGHFHFSDLATQITPLAVLPDVPKKLTNDTLGAYTELDYAPYGVSAEFWNTTNNQFDFSSLSLGDSLLVRTDLHIITTSANQTFTIYLKLGIGTASEYDLLIDRFNVKTIITDLHIIKDVSFSIDNDDWNNAPAEVYILSDDDAIIKVNGWYVPIVRKSVNIIDFNSDPLKLDKVTTNDVEKVYIKNADGTQGMKPVSEFGGGDVTLIHKFTGNGTSITNSPNFISNKSYSVLIPANTFMVGDFVTIEAAFTKLSGGGVEFHQEFYINNIDSLSGAAKIAYSAFTPANRVFSKTKRTLAIKSSTETEILHHGTSTAIDYFSAATGGNRNIDWTTDKYIIFALLQNGATDSVARLSSCLITKI